MLYFVRHAHTGWNEEGRIQGSQDTELSLLGQKQAQRFADELNERVKAGLRIDAIYSSPQKRALQTAEVLAERLDLVLQVWPGLEEMTYGKWEGKRWVEVEELYPEEVQLLLDETRFVSPHGGESYQEMLERTLSAVAAASKRHGKGEKLLFVTHGAVLMAFRSMLSVGHLAQVTDYKLDNVELWPMSKAEFERLYSLVFSL